jgi:hypothetical protein
MRIVIVTILAGLLLAACATASTDTPALPTLAATQPTDPAPAQTDPQAPPDSVQPTAEPGDASVNAQEAPTVSAMQQAIEMLPPPGTAIAPATEEAAAQAGVPFFNITYQETGGPANTELLIDIFADGRVVRNGAEMTISPEVVAELNQMLQDVQFFGLQGQFTMFGAPSDVYTYFVRVELQDGAARSLEAQDRVTPPELLRLFSRLRSIGA